jgi:hypothetical protein
MTSFEQLLIDLVDNLPPDEGRATDGIRVAITSVEMNLPIESRMMGGRFSACLPRGCWQSGFEVPHGALAARFERTGG